MRWFLPFMQRQIMRRTEGELACLVAMLVLVLVPGAAAMAATCTSVTGALNCNTAGSWRCGNVPATRDAVIPPTASKLSLNDDTCAPETPRGDTGGVITVQSDADFDICLASISSAPVGAGNTWPQWNWSGISEKEDPAARATFGAYLNADAFIYLRGNSWKCCAVTS